MAKENRIMYKNKLKNQEESLQKTLTRKNKGKGWTKTTNEIMKEINITEEDLQESTTTTRKTIKGKINTAFEKEINTTGKEKHKVQHQMDTKRETTIHDKINKNRSKHYIQGKNQDDRR